MNRNFKVLPKVPGILKIGKKIGLGVQSREKLEKLDIWFSIYKNNYENQGVFFK